MKQPKDIGIAFRELEKKYNPRYRPEIIYVNISSSFLARTRCVKCQGKPERYSYIRLPFKWKDHTYQKDDFAINIKWTGRMNDDWYLDAQPRYFRSATDFSTILEGKSFDPVLHRATGARVPYSDNVIDLIMCGCGYTGWAFNQKSTKNRPEITNRKGRYNYPKRFEF